MHAQASRGSQRFAALYQIPLVIAALFVTSGILAGLIAPNLPAPVQQPILGLALWGGVGAGAWLLRQAHLSYRAIGLVRPDGARSCAGWTLVAIFAAEGGAIPLGLLLHHGLGWPPLDVSYIRNAIRGDLVSYIAWMLLVVWGSAAFGEELLNRGFILNRLLALCGQGRAGVTLAIIGQGIIFGALHAIQGPTGMLVTAYIGMVFAGVYFLAGRNLWPVILAHGLIDSVGLTLMYLDLPLPSFMQ